MHCRAAVRLVDLLGQIWKLTKLVKFGRQQPATWTLFLVQRKHIFCLSAFIQGTLFSLSETQKSFQHLLLKYPKRKKLVIL
jgi:hypothetical protein